MLSSGSKSRIGHVGEKLLGDAPRYARRAAEAKVAKDFQGDFKMWCENPPTGSYAIPGGKVVRDESETVRNNPRWRREREFPVPSEVDQSGRLFMGHPYRRERERPS